MLRGAATTASRRPPGVRRAGRHHRHASTCRSRRSRRCWPGSAPTSRARATPPSPSCAATPPGRRAGRPPVAVHQRLSRRPRCTRYADGSVERPGARALLAGHGGGLARGRLYVPEEDLRHFGVDPADMPRPARTSAADRGAPDRAGPLRGRPHPRAVRARPPAGRRGRRRPRRRARDHVARRHAHPRQDLRRRRRGPRAPAAAHQRTTRRRSCRARGVARRQRGPPCRPSARHGFPGPADCDRERRAPMDPMLERTLLGIAHALYINRLHVLRLTEVVRLGIRRTARTARCSSPRSSTARSSSRPSTSC